MLIHAIAVALPLALAAGDRGSTGSSAATNEKTDTKVRDDSLPGPSGAKAQGGIGAPKGQKGRKDERAAGEASDTTSGAPSGRWDRAGGTGSAGTDPSQVTTGPTDEKAKADAKPDEATKKTKTKPKAKAKKAPPRSPEAKGAEKAPEGKPAEAK